MSALRAQIRVEMDVRGMNQSDLARSTGISTSGISRYLHDKYDRDIPYCLVVDIAKALGLDTAELIARADRKPAGEPTR